MKPKNKLGIRVIVDGQIVTDTVICALSGHTLIGRYNTRAVPIPDCSVRAFIVCDERRYSRASQEKVNAALEAGREHVLANFSAPPSTARKTSKKKAAAALETSTVTDEAESVPEQAPEE